MAKLVWDQTGERQYETGVSKGVLYQQASDGTYGEGEAWNGLTGVTETPSGAEETKLYANNGKYLSMRSAEEFGGTIEAYMYPDGWAACDGSAELVTGVHIGQQARKSFGLTYQTLVGNDTVGDAFGYKLHLVYGASVSPSERAYATVNDSPEAATFSWEFSTNPVEIPSYVGDHKPTAILTIDTTELTGGKNNTYLKAVESALYGEDAYVKIPMTEDMFKANKTRYYTKAGEVYTQCTASTNYSGTTSYYVKTPTLLLPQEVYMIFSASGATGATGQ